MTAPVITRFAPSPTGFLHIGGARTALFNWLYARGRNGKFLLRIEDTDRARSTPEAAAAILDGLSWLGLDWDGEPISQFARAERHREAAQALIARGAAYRCFATREEVDAAREKARAEKRPLRFDSPWRDADPASAPDAPFVVRLKAPRAGEVVVEDAVQGTVRWAAEQLDDLVLLRSDGTPTYMLAVVVDDHDMGVTHVIRGDDHLTNAARQTLIYQGLGWRTPVFAHIPLIHGADGAKLSKRHGALGAEAYREMGVVAPALRNYLARLGWGHGDDEMFTDAQAQEWFGFDGIGKAPARFDVAKLTDLNGRWIRAMEDEAILDAYAVYLAAQHRDAPDTALRARLRAAMPGLKPRVKTLAELYDMTYYLRASRPLDMDDKARKALGDEARLTIAKLTALLADATQWRSAALEETARGFAEGEGLKLGKVAQPLRAALTGRAVSPGVFEVMETLGREEVLARLHDQF